MTDAVGREWDRRSNQMNDAEFFHWPSSDTNGKSGKGLYGNLPDEGMLRYLEYRVGMHGEHSSSRQALLSRIFEGILPPVFDRLYMAQWGTSGSSIRLHKMAHCLASFAKNFKRLGSDRYDEAIRHWEQDLEYLHDKYYVGRFGFGWPTAKS